MITIKLDQYKLSSDDARYFEEHYSSYDITQMSKKELVEALHDFEEEFDKQLEQAYKNADKVQYERGYRKAVEDARKWVAWYTGDREVSLSLFDTEMEQKLKELSQG